MTQQRLPLLVTRPFIRWRVRRALDDPASINDARQQMEYLLGAIGRSAEVEAASREYVEHWVWCDSLRWHPRSITRQRIDGSQHLVAAVRLGRGVVLSFVHHAHFAGVFASVARTGIPVHVVAAALTSPGPNFIQHLTVVGKGGGLVSAARGTTPASSRSFAREESLPRPSMSQVGAPRPSQGAAFDARRGQRTQRSRQVHRWWY